MSTDTQDSPSSPGTIRVFLVDDHELVRRGLCDVLMSVPDLVVVGECADAAEAVRRIPELAPDVVVLDVRLPDGSGIEVCRQVRVLAPSVRVLMLTSYDDRGAQLDSVRAGASGFALKQIRGRALIEAIRAVAATGPPAPQTSTAGVLGRLPAGPRPDQVLESLSGQEHRVLDGIVDGLTNREIGERLGIAEQTVKNHVTNLLAKLGVRYRTQAAVLGAQARSRPSWSPGAPQPTRRPDASQASRPAGPPASPGPPACPGPPGPGHPPTARTVGPPAGGGTR